MALLNAVQMYSNATQQTPYKADVCDISPRGAAAGLRIRTPCPAEEGQPSPKGGLMLYYNQSFGESVTLESVLGDSMHVNRSKAERNCAGGV